MLLVPVLKRWTYTRTREQVAQRRQSQLGHASAKLLDTAQRLQT